MCVGVLMPGDKGLVAVFAKPGGPTAAEVIARADGGIIFVRDGSWVALTESEDHEFIASLYRAGAGFVASSAVAQVCARWNGFLGDTRI
ncbi:hypothetical protein DCO57_18065 [Labrenzia sp. 011]|nr:hypothetical protein DCO57_18065 [Labrenzia sp. 011]